MEAFMIAPVKSFVEVLLFFTWFDLCLSLWGLPVFKFFLKNLPGLFVLTDKIIGKVGWAVYVDQILQYLFISKIDAV